MDDFTPNKMDAPPEVSPEQLPTRRVHILGPGSIGSLVAHSLKTLPNPPPISLLLRPDQFDDFRRHGSLIRLIDKINDVHDEQTDFDIDVRELKAQVLEQTSSDPQRYLWARKPAYLEGQRDAKILKPPTQAELMDSDENFIFCLVVSVKAPSTIEALLSVKHRLDSRSTICLMQNGLGQIDELNQVVFTDPEYRPTYLQGVISHGCFMEGPSTVVHAGFGATSLGIYRDTDKHPLPPKDLPTDQSRLSDSDRKKYYPTDEELYSSISSRYLLRTLTRSPTLACALYPYLDLLQLQLEKLSSNALLNPLTALLDIPNGATLNNNHLSTVQNLLVSEISLVIRSLPELQHLPGIQQRFSAERLKKLFVAVAKKTARNSSSMREDIRKHRQQTEIEYINGYIVRRGQELGIQCALNFMMLQLIKARTKISFNIGGDVVPFETSRIEGSFAPFPKWEAAGDGVAEEDTEGVMIEDVGSMRKGETS